MHSLELDKLKIELKTWEHEFIDTHNREPTKDDIKSLRNVKHMYKQYSILKKKQSSRQQDFVAQESAEVSVQNQVQNEIMEIGPTPQVHGKAISIFEMNVSPIKPIYMTFTGNADANNDDSKTISNGPSPQKTISQESSPTNRTLVSASISSVKRQLNFQILKAPSSCTPILSPCKDQKELLLENKRCSPGYPIAEPLLEPNKPSGYYGPNSPLKLEEENIHLNIASNSNTKCRIQMAYPSLQKTPSRDNRMDLSISFSPSPLIRRPLTKSLIELAKEHNEIVKEFSSLQEENEELEGSDENCVGEEDSEDESKLEDGFVRPRVVKDIFQEDDNDNNQTEEGAIIRKRPKRRKVIRRLRDEDPEVENSAVTRDVHKELMKLKRRKVAEFLGSTSQLSNNAPEDDDSANSNAEPVQKPAAKRKGRKKYNLVSNNFRRLKLPKKNRFPNRRWGRR
ncbi:sld2p [Saccharomyces arboricola H-6]|uniref:DNA replication regulator SLD2 n=1 Tax=Saccharomyces arboricola (strain H-6 / AS 2.3317 / CBS 10644) TaxID=1160507 RepID=J8LLK4_SACAR|nr:sld2p [Saccharomyces arboricola H-6]